jgi:hypothetical protein
VALTVSVEELPSAIVVGLAEIVTVGALVGAGGVVLPELLLVPLPHEVIIESVANAMQMNGAKPNNFAAIFRVTAELLCVPGYKADTRM